MPNRKEARFREKQNFVYALSFSQGPRPWAPLRCPRPPALRPRVQPSSLAALSASSIAVCGLRTKKTMKTLDSGTDFTAFAPPETMADDAPAEAAPKGAVRALRTLPAPLQR
jgi:hypothetical protein